MEHAVQVWNDRAKEITALHNGIEAAYRRSVDDALKIGELLDAQRQDIDHGKFLKWVTEKLPFCVKTAYRYLGLWDRKDKIVTVTNLQDAYKEVQQLQSDEKRKEQERKRKLIDAYVEKGEKPEGWDRSVEYEYQKRLELGTALSEANQDVDINEGEPIEEEVLLDYKDAIDEEYVRTVREKAHEKAKRTLVRQIDTYLGTYPEDIEYLQAYLVHRKMALPQPRTDAEVDRIVEGSAY